MLIVCWEAIREAMTIALRAHFSNPKWKSPKRENQCDAFLCWENPATSRVQWKHVIYPSSWRQHTCQFLCAKALRWERLRVGGKVQCAKDLRSAVMAWEKRYPVTRGSSKATRDHDPEDLQHRTVESVADNGPQVGILISTCGRLDALWGGG